MGCREIDNVLGGGISSESVSLIYGEAETGKTTLAMQFAVHCAEQDYKTLFIDCDGTFSAKRLSQIASEEFKQVARMIILMRPNNFREQTLAIDQLTDYLTKSFGLVIIDTITGLYRAKISESPAKAFELNRELNRQMALLAQIAKTQKICILLISQVRNVFEEAYVRVEPVATRVVKFWADTIIAMKPTENPRIINAILEKSPSKTKRSQPLTFQLEKGKTGIHEHSIH
jgi:RecA/RadA recombinase